jgi:opacity protein-like surface antigen
MKIKLILALLLAVLLTPLAMAEDSPDGSGYYVGLNLGYANRHLDQNSFFQGGPSSITTKGAAGRISAGYALGPNFAFEAGGTLLPDAKASFPTYQVKSSGYLVDFLLRASIPFQHDFSAYGKIGMSYVSTLVQVTNQPNSQASEFRPVIALGGAYALNKSVSFNMEWYRMLGSSNSLNGYAQTKQAALGGTYTQVPSIDIFTVGVAYLF